MAHIRMNETLSKYSEKELEARVKELSDQGMSKTRIYRALGVSETAFRRHMAILNDPKGYAKKQAEGRAVKGKEQAEVNDGRLALNDDNFWVLPEVALEKFKKDLKEKKEQRMLKEARDPYD